MCCCVRSMSGHVLPGHPRSPVDDDGTPPWLWKPPFNSELEAMDHVYVYTDTYMYIYIYIYIHWIIGYSMMIYLEKNVIFHDLVKLETKWWFQFWLLHIEFRHNLNWLKLLFQICWIRISGLRLSYGHFQSVYMYLVESYRRPMYYVVELRELYMDI